MPEGDTVWRTARRLDRALAGQVLTDSQFRVPRLATVNLAGYRVLRTVSRGKHLLTHLEGAQALTLHSHLRMEGTWQLYPIGERWRRPAKDARVVLQAADRLAVGFLLGKLDLVLRSEEHQLVGHLGPDLLGADWDEVEALSRLRADPTRAISVALLDQRNLAGIGNMYQAELCFLAGIRPDRPVAEVPDLARIVRRARAILQANKERAQQSTTGDLRRGEQFWVYRRAGEPCRRCGTTIRSAHDDQDPQARTSYWCPHCQPE